MTKERLNALQDIRDTTNKLWALLLTDHEGNDDNSLNFIDHEDRAWYRSVLTTLTNDITDFIHDELKIHTDTQRDRPGADYIQHPVERV